MKSVYVFERTTKLCAEIESALMEGESIYKVLKSTNTRHVTLAFPIGENPLEYLNRYWSEILDGIVRTIGVELRHIAVVGYAVVDEQKRKPHAHLLVYSRKERRGGRCWKVVSRDEIKRLVDLFQVKMSINMKVTPFFNFPGWVEYVTGDDNMLAKGFTTIRLPVFNPRILRSATKRRHGQSANVSSVGMAIVS